MKIWLLFLPFLAFSCGDSDLPTAAALKPAELCPVDPSVPDSEAFNIEVVFLRPSKGSRDFTDHEKEVIRGAARRWEDKFTGDIPDMRVREIYAGIETSQFTGFPYPSLTPPHVVDDVLVYFTSSKEEEFILHGRIDMFLPNDESVNSQPAGIVVLDVEDASKEFDDYRFAHRQYTDILIENFAAHGIGHILQGPKWHDFIGGTDYDKHFNGPNAIDQFLILMQQDGLNFSGEGIPMTWYDTIHWPTGSMYGGRALGGKHRYFDFDSAGEGIGQEMMNRWSILFSTKGQREAISRVTLGALKDIGYPVDMEKADLYHFDVSLSDMAPKPAPPPPALFPHPPFPPVNS